MDFLFAKKLVLTGVTNALYSSKTDFLEGLVRKLLVLSYKNRLKEVYLYL